MTEPTRTEDDLDSRRRRARFRAWHRGMRETDLILGAFADREIATLDGGDLERFEALLHEADAEILDWIAGRRPVPDHVRSPLFARIAASANAAA